MDIEQEQKQEPQEQTQQQPQDQEQTQRIEQTRLKGVSITRTVVYGSEAHWLGKKHTTSGNTHRWRAYVRGADMNEDISYFIKRVVFYLHPSFTNPKRVVEKPPFEITENGWGEFEILIVLYFTDPTEKPVELVHPLKLFSRDEPNRKNKPVISENYEEIIFSDPTEQFYKILMEHPQPTLRLRTDTNEICTIEEQQELERIRNAQQKVKYEISQLLTKYSEVAQQITQLRREIHKLQTRSNSKSNAK